MKDTKHKLLKSQTTFNYLESKHKTFDLSQELKNKYSLIIHCYIDQIIPYRRYFKIKNSYHGVGSIAFGYRKEKQYKHLIDVAYVRRFVGNSTLKADNPNCFQSINYAYSKLNTKPESIKFSHLYINDIDNIIKYIMQDSIIIKSLNKLTVEEEIMNKNKIYNCLKILFQDINMLE